MRIRSVKVYTAALERPEPLLTSYGAEQHTHSVIAAIEAEDGTVGFGESKETTPFYGQPLEEQVYNIKQFLGPAIVGLDALQTNVIWDRMDAALPGHFFARCAVDVAAWDLKGKLLGRPVVDCIGGRLGPGARVDQRLIPRKTPKESGALARGMYDAGDRVFKTKIGFGIQEDVAHIRAVVENLGPDASLQVDANTNLSLGEAFAVAMAVRDRHPLLWFEQPVKTLDQMAVLSRQLGIAVVADEAVASPEDALEACRMEACKAVLLKMYRLGGITPAIRIAHVLEAGGIPFAFATYFNLMEVAAAHLGAAFPLARHSNGLTRLKQHLTAELLPIEDGRLVVSDAPGLGVEVRMDLLRER